METSGETFVNIAEIAPARGGVGSDELIIRAADLLVEREVGRAAQAAALRVLVKNAAEEKRVIADVARSRNACSGVARVSAISMSETYWRSPSAVMCGARKPLARENASSNDAT